MPSARGSLITCCSLIWNLGSLFVSSLPNSEIARKFEIILEKTEEEFRRNFGNIWGPSKLNPATEQIKRFSSFRVVLFKGHSVYPHTIYRPNRYLSLLWHFSLSGNFLRSLKLVGKILWKIINFFMADYRKKFVRIDAYVHFHFKKKFTIRGNDVNTYRFFSCRLHTRRGKRVRHHIPNPR